ncbi:hypothetical protein KRP22_001211 [Phytophthora ramorum]|uniref:uncharacterized protein n=1 Tax=Phytophthora ramorum TaxID=164328 RepID=UPI0030B640EA|nr:hypothetical protein KRP23_7969 [Phytophthora ramorum]KAH7508538.1 hypothetical protein KRP22_52 [Phytophthora ramorum]
MKAERTFVTLDNMTRAAPKIWQFVAKYTAKSLFCHGVDGDIAMAKNSRRVFADASSPTKKRPKKGTHIAFDDKCKLITPDNAALYVPPAPRAQVVALANWESAPTFVLDEQLGEGFSKASADRLLNKCNPFLSGKRRALSDDISSETPTVSTDCSTIPEIENEDQELDVVEEEETVIDEQETVTLNEQTSGAIQCETTDTSLVDSQTLQTSAVELEMKKQVPRWVCVGHGRYVRCDDEQIPKASSNQKTETPWTVRWVQVGYGRYEKCYGNGAKFEKAVPTN